MKKIVISHKKNPGSPEHQKYIKKETPGSVLRKE